MSVEIAGRRVGPGHPCFVIAEAGVNHNGNMNLAHDLIRAAARAGADAVKFQTFCAARLATAAAPKAAYQRARAEREESQLAMLQRLELDEPAHRTLMAWCAEAGILFLSSPFEEQSADMLERLGVAAFKIPSGELTNLPFLAHVARKQKPLIVSTGMSTLDEVREAVDAVHATGNSQLVLLHCVSLYPAEPADVNLRAMDEIARAFAVPVGYSDHTLGMEVALAAVALGATVVEKHFTVDRGLPGPDHQASAEPAELEALVRGIRKVEEALGAGRKQPAAAERAVAAVARKSIVASRDIPPGTVLTSDMVALMRPGSGLPSSILPQVVGRTARVEIPQGTLITMAMLS